MTVVMTSCNGNGGTTSTQQDNSTQLEQQKQDSIREANAEAERVKKEQEEQARLEAEREAKKWKGVTSLSEFKSKLPGTTWGRQEKEVISISSLKSQITKLSLLRITAVISAKIPNLEIQQLK